MRPRLAVITVTTAALLAAGCSGTADRDLVSAGEQAGTSTAAGGVRGEHGLGGLTAEQVITRLDRAETKPELMASVRYDELQLTGSDDATETLAIEDGFYLSFAPYLRTTHDCYYHSLTTCQGELVETDLDVTITDAVSGEVLVDDTMTTYPNGFVGVWLPRGITAELEVSYDGRSGRTTVGTGPQDPTCLTTLQLT